MNIESIENKVKLGKKLGKWNTEKQFLVLEKTMGHSLNSVWLLKNNRLTNRRSYLVVWYDF